MSSRRQQVIHFQASSPSKVRALAKLFTARLLVIIAHQTLFSNIYCGHELEQECMQMSVSSSVLQ